MARERPSTNPSVRSDGFPPLPDVSHRRAGLSADHGKRGNAGAGMAHHDGAALEHMLLNHIYIKDMYFE
mgnify:CR=1 FL=1